MDDFFVFSQSNHLFLFRLFTLLSSAPAFLVDVICAILHIKNIKYFYVLALAVDGVARIQLCFCGLYLIPTGYT